MKKRPHILTIAGFDPSGGAGVLADIKVFEQHRCQGMAVLTANTSQTEDEFEWVEWVDPKQLEQQLQLLLKKYQFHYVKIGIVESGESLKRILNILSDYPNVKVIWDPILRASSGHTFHESGENLLESLSKVFMITPNWDEVKALTGEEDAEKAAETLSEKCLVYLKGGHRDSKQGQDILFDKGERKSFNPRSGSYFPKHGSGCVLSAAIVSNLAKGYPLQKGVLRAKRYVEQFLESSQGLIGAHN